MIGSLLYLTASRPDIVFSVGLCARFQTSPKESHLQAVKRILRYLKGTTDLGLWYPKGSNFELVGYVDADYAGYLANRKHTTDTHKSLTSNPSVKAPVRVTRFVQRTRDAMLLAKSTKKTRSVQSKFVLPSNPIEIDDDDIIGPKKSRKQKRNTSKPE
ncbi:secreted RxLR effector protein 161-like [Solanum stenotomum]|uniref:secreted RxLR effector protein 161-like n=1 Tax=Solanum stenotomum TaxID=172797 RepID=UPI0020D1F2E8|nr:secreted RxLR effector protein 161-like [Solanum stenotomum]